MGDEIIPMYDMTSSSTFDFSDRPTPSPTPPAVHAAVRPFNLSSERKRLSRRLFEICFYFHLYSVVMLSTYLVNRVFVSDKSRYFRSVSWYPPLTAAVGCGSVIASAWYCFIRCLPNVAVRAAFLLSPLMTCAVGVLFILIHSASSLGLGIVAIILGVAQALYSFWAIPRMNYAGKIVFFATAIPPNRMIAVIFSVLVIATLFSVLPVCAMAIPMEKDILCIFFMVVSMVWILHTLMNMLLATIACAKYLNFACNDNSINLWRASGNTITYLVGAVAMGSAIVPVIALVRGLALAILSVSVGAGELTSLFVDHCTSLAETLPTRGNRYGFVYAGVYNRGFVKASRDAWEVFKQSRMIELIDSDVTGMFCCFMGMTGGAASALVSGWWMLATHQHYALEVVLYALLFGYLMCRIGTVWVEASVSAYYIAYGEDPLNDHFDDTIPARIEEICRGQDPSNPQD